MGYLVGYKCQKTAKNQCSLRSFGWLGQLDSNRDKINFNMFAEVDIWHDKAKKAGVLIITKTYSNQALVLKVG